MASSVFLVVVAYFAKETCAVDCDIIHPPSERTCKEPEVENSKVVGGKKSTYNHKDCLKISCDTRYTLLGGSIIKCMPDGSWSQNPPYCQEVTCPGIFTLPNGTISPDVKKAKIGTVFNISCDDYFLLMGSKSIKCNEGGMWEPHRMLYCKEVRCPDFPGIEHGETHPITPLRPGTVTVTCKKGYEREGPEKLTCTEDGKWSPNIMPYCIMERDSIGGLIASILGTAFIFAVLLGCLYKKNCLGPRGQEQGPQNAVPQEQVQPPVEMLTLLSVEQAK